MDGHNKENQGTMQKFFDKRDIIIDHYHIATVTTSTGEWQDISTEP